MAVYQTPPHQLWASPGVRADEPAPSIVVVLDARELDLVMVVPEEVGETIVEFELPHLVEVRPHRDPGIEAWLERWLDCVSDNAGNNDYASLAFPARCIAGLSELVTQRPEVCPLLRSQLMHAERALVEWLRSWPRVEPAREGLPQGSIVGGPPAPSVAELELELYVALTFVRDCTLSQSVAENFRQVAIGWICKLDSLYGAGIADQPERLSAVVGESKENAAVIATRLSLLAWGADEIAELLRCPFFRPQELTLRRLARRWWLEGSHNGTAGHNGDAADARISQALLWELLPPRETLSGVASDEVPGSLQDVVACRDEVPPHGTHGSADLAAEERSPDNVDCVDSSGLGGAVCNGATGEGDVHEACGVGAGVRAVMQVSGSTFERVKRRPDCPTCLYDDPAALCTKVAGSGILRCWNMAVETQVVGAARQMLASSSAMCSAHGVYRLDLRVVGGVEAESALFFEVGIVAEPWAGVQFRGDTSGACRPESGFTSENLPSSFFRFVAVPGILMEGVRLVVEIDFDSRTVRLRNLPEVDGGELAAQPTPLAAWLDARSWEVEKYARPPGELDDQLFRDQAAHLHELIDEGTLTKDLADVVLRDGGARCLRGAATPEAWEDYHFYVVVPAGMEVEIY